MIAAGALARDAFCLHVGMAVFKQRENGGEPLKYQGANEAGEACAQSVRKGAAMVWAAGGQPVKLRSTPGTEKPYLAKVPVGSMVAVYETAMNSGGQEWSGVSYHGKRGFVMSQFLLGVTG